MSHSASGTTAVGRRNSRLGLFRLAGAAVGDGLGDGHGAGGGLGGQERGGEGGGFDVHFLSKSV